MSDYNIIDSYELFKDTLNHCGLFLLDLSDEDIGYHLFEEFDGDCVSFLNEKNLNQLCLSGKITQEVVDVSIELSRKFRALEGTELWNVESVRVSDKWREILLLSDKIKDELTLMMDRTRCFDWFNRKVYRVFSGEDKDVTGFLTEYIDHPTVLRSLAIGVNKTLDTITPGKLTLFYRNGEEYSFECFVDSVFCGQYGITVSDDGERIYVISSIKGLRCYNKHGEVIWKTRYTSAGQVYPHANGTVTCVTGRHLILLDANGKTVKKRALFDGVSCETSAKTIAILTSENMAAVIDIETLEPILKISLSKLNIYRFRAILMADEYYVLQGTELLGMTDLPNGRRDIQQKEVIYLLDRDGNVIRKIDDGNWTWASRAYVDRTANEVVLYALYKHHTSETYRIHID